MADPTLVPTVEEIYRAKRDMNDINTFTVSKDLTFPDSEGRERLTLDGVIDKATTVIKASGFYPVAGSFELGGMITERNQVLQRTTAPAAYFSWGGALPKVVPPGSTVEGTGGEGVTAWTNRNDATLAGALAEIDSDVPIAGQQAKKYFATFDTVAEMQAAVTSAYIGRRIQWLGYHALSDGGSGWGIVKSGSYTADGGSIIAIGANLYIEQNLKGSSINVRKFGVRGDSVTDDTVLVQAAIDYATAINSLAPNKIRFPSSSGAYILDGVTINKPVRIVGNGQLNTIISPKTTTSECFIFVAGSEMASLSGLHLRGTGRLDSTIALQIKAALIHVSDCFFAFFGTCIDMPAGFGSAECRFSKLRLASSTLGIKALGGQLNTSISKTTFNDIDCGLYVRENTAGGSPSTTEGFNLTVVNFFFCGTATTPAIDIVGTRWTWLTDVMCDQSKGSALIADNAKHLHIKGGYYSSNLSTGKSCVVLKNASDDFSLVDVTFADSRNWGLEIEQSKGKGSNCTFQNNDINPSQNGDLLVNGSSPVRLSGCDFLSNKPTAIAVLNNIGGPSDVIISTSQVVGGVLVDTPNNNILRFRDTPAFPNESREIVQFAVGETTKTIPLTVKDPSGKGIVTVGSSSNYPNSGIAVGVSGSNLVISRTDGANADAVCVIASTMV